MATILTQQLKVNHHHYHQTYAPEISLKLKDGSQLTKYNETKTRHTSAEAQEAEGHITADYTNPKQAQYNQANHHRKEKEMKKKTRVTVRKTKVSPKKTKVAYKTTKVRYKK